MGEIRENKSEDRGFFRELIFEGREFHKWLHTDKYCNEQYDPDINAVISFIESGDCSWDQSRYASQSIMFLRR